MAHLIDQVDLLKKQLDGLKPITSENQQRLDKKFRLEFNYNSNHMEGNTLTYAETELLLMFEDTKGAHTMREFDEMRAHDVALRMVEELAREKERPLTEQFIKNLNETILVKPFWKDAITEDGQNTRREIKIGNYKEHPNSVRLENGEIFAYATPGETPILMAELIDWLRTEEGIVHPLTLAAILHYKFVRIHPFDDGNGRVARLLMNYVLIRFGFPPIVIKSDDKKNYLRVLHIADVGDMEPLIEYVGRELIWSLQISIRGAKGESVDEPGDLDKKVKALKRKLNTDEDARVRITKSKSAIKIAYEMGIYPLLAKLGAKLAELDAVFKSTSETLTIIAANKNFTVSKEVQTFKQEISTIAFPITHLQYTYWFENLRKQPKKMFSTGITLQFIFHTNLYEVVAISTNISQRDKLYDEQFSESELNELIEEIGNFVVEAIDGALE